MKLRGWWNFVPCFSFTVKSTTPTPFEWTTVRFESSPTKHPNHSMWEALYPEGAKRILEGAKRMINWWTGNPLHSTPPRMVLEHPLSKRLSLYGMNGGTCRVLPKEAVPCMAVKKLSWSQSCNLVSLKEKEPTGNDDQRSTHVMSCLPPHPM